MRSLDLPFCDSLTLWSSVWAMSLGSACLTGFLPTGGGITGFFPGKDGAGSTVQKASIRYKVINYMYKVVDSHQFTSNIYEKFVGGV